MNKKIVVFSLFLAVIVFFSSTITAQAATKLTISPTSTTIQKGYTKKLTCKINGKKVNNSKCVFSSSKKSVATVSSAGTIKGINPGTAYITVKVKAKKSVYKKCKVVVKKNSIKADMTSLTLQKGKTKQMKVTLNGASATSTTVGYKSSNTNIATVSSTGYIKTLATGSVTIKAYCKKDSSCYINLKLSVVGTSSFSISPSSTPLNGKYLNYTTYNSTTRPYFTLRSYMDALESSGGGTLTLKAGTYNITNVVYIPSNVTIILSDGVTINKTSVTNTDKMSASGTLFMLCAPSKASTTQAYSGYNGVHNVTFKTIGTATINMKSAPSNKTCVGIVLCHNKDINFEGITFTGLNVRGHFVELDASKNITFNNCTFTDEQKDNITHFDECINLDIPDEKTGGITQSWVTYDCTPNDGITVESCSFNKIQAAVGTHTYTQGKYHTNIVINNCKISNAKKCAIDIKNWKDAKITNNIINGVGMNTSGTDYSGATTTNNYGIYSAGADNPTITSNTFKNVYNGMYFTIGTSDAGYEDTYNQLDTADYYEIANNNSLHGSTIKNTYMTALYVGQHNKDESFTSPVRLYSEYSPTNGNNY